MASCRRSVLVLLFRRLFQRRPGKRIFERWSGLKMRIRVRGFRTLSCSSCVSRVYTGQDESRRLLCLSFLSLLSRIRGPGIFRPPCGVN